MSLLKALELESNKKYTLNGAVTNMSSLNRNLDYFLYSTKYIKDEIVPIFTKALIENDELAIKNLLFKLDIREGKGLRAAFKSGFKTLIEYSSLNSNKYDDKIKIIIDLIPILGRWDYILEALNTEYHDYVISKIYNQILEDINNMDKNESVSLLAKWLPSHRIGRKNNFVAKNIIKSISLKHDKTFNEKKYRKTLSTLRTYIEIVEKKLANNEAIDFNKVPTLAQLKYANVFRNKYSESYAKYLYDIKNNNLKAKANNLFMDEIVGRILDVKNAEELLLLNSMWDKQDFNIEGMNHNILPVIDTSGSMMGRPLNCALALGVLLSEKNKGLFKDHFITFSRKAKLVKIKGDNLSDKLKSFTPIVEDSNIDSVFGLILNVMLKKNLTVDELPSHIIIVSDMEFNIATDNRKTNFHYWEELYKKNGFSLPKIIFWNVSVYFGTMPVTKYDENVAMISGYSKNVFNNILQLDQLSPINAMLEALEKYDVYFK